MKTEIIWIVNGGPHDIHTKPQTFDHEADALVCFNERKARNKFVCLLREVRLITVDTLNCFDPSVYRDYINSPR
jgi:hypothetical protein